MLCVILGRPAGYQPARLVSGRSSVRLRQPAPIENQWVTSHRPPAVRACFAIWIPFRIPDLTSTGRPADLVDPLRATRARVLFGRTHEHDQYARARVRVVRTVAPPRSRNACQSELPHWMSHPRTSMPPCLHHTSARGAHRQDLAGTVTPSRAWRLTATPRSAPAPMRHGCGRCPTTDAAPSRVSRAPTMSRNGNLSAMHRLVTPVGRAREPEARA